jgi:hypothetical protein
MIQREDFEICDQAHEMYAEGCQGGEPLEDDVLIAVGLAGYEASDIDIHFDDMQKLWRWTCAIEAPIPAGKTNEFWDAFEL